MPHASAHSRHRRLGIVLITLVVTCALLFAGYEWLVSAAQSTLRKRLNEHGLNLTCSSESWSLLGGITLKDAALRGLPDDQPLIELSALHVDILWRDAWRARAAVTRWRIDDGTLTLHDEAGEVKLQRFTTDFSVQEDKIEIDKLHTANGPVEISVAGQLILGTSKKAPPPEEKQPFHLNLKPVRAVLNALDFKAAPNAFAITGSFSVDLRPEDVLWSATLHGIGKKVEWREVPMQHVTLDTQLSQAALKLTADIAFAQGTASVEATRAGWADEPLALSGTLTDGAGRKDEFKGQQSGKTETVTISHLSGRANLFELARNIPAAAAALPPDVKVTTFPDIVARDFVWHAGKNPGWTLASLQLRSAADLIVQVREHPLVIEHLQGSLSYDHRTWHIKDLNGRMLGGGFRLSANYDGKKLSDAEVALQSLHLDTLTPWLGKLSAKLEDAEMSLSYHGVIGNDPTNSTGTGSLDLVQAPVVHVPLLDQAYQLFPKVLSRERPHDTGEVRVKFVINQGVAMVEPMKVLGQSVVVTARGTVDLNKRSVDGHARANVRGVAGVVMAPVSVLFLEMKVKGPFNDLRVAPLGVIGAAKSVIENTAKLSTLVIREGVSVPFEALGMFRSEKGSGSE